MTQSTKKPLKINAEECHDFDLFKQVFMPTTRHQITDRAYLDELADTLLGIQAILLRNAEVKGEIEEGFHDCTFVKDGRYGVKIEAAEHPYATTTGSDGIEHTHAPLKPGQVWKTRDGRYAIIGAGLGSGYNRVMVEGASDFVYFKHGSRDPELDESFDLLTLVRDAK